MLHLTAEGLGGTLDASHLVISCQGHCTLKPPLGGSPGAFSAGVLIIPYVWVGISKHVHTHYFFLLTK